MTDADRPSGKAGWLLVVPIGVTVLGLLVGYAADLEDLAALSFMHSVPRGDVSALRSGPAIYRGRVQGPEDRVTPTGRPAAAYWWWLRTTGKNSRDVCFATKRDGLALASGTTTLSLSLFGLTSSSNLCVVSDERDDWACRIFVDLGGTPVLRQDATPPEAAEHCSAPEYVERYLPADADAEVLACSHDGELVPCSGPVAAVVVAGTLEQHRERRRESALQVVRFFGVAVTVACLVVMIILAALSEKRTKDVGRRVNDKQATS